MDQGWKLTVAGIEARDLLYTRPFSPYSNFDKATEYFYQFLSAATAIGVIGAIGGTAGTGVALLVGGAALTRAYFKYHNQKEECRDGEIALREQPELRDVKINRIFDRLSGYMKRLGIHKGLRIIDISRGFHNAKHQIALPNAASFNFRNDDLEDDAATIGTNKATTDLLTPDELTTVLAHEEGHLARDNTKIIDRFDKLATITKTAIWAGAFLGNPWLLALLPVQNMIQKSYMRHEEFRADRASIFLTKAPVVFAHALDKIHKEIIHRTEGAHEKRMIQNMTSSAEKRGLIGSLFRTAMQYACCDHPTVDRRMRRLAAMKRQINADKTPRWPTSGTRVPYRTLAMS